MADERYLDFEGLQKFTNKILGELNKAIPSGVITMWSGSADKVPNGWAICDGQNGTPDLRGRFVLGGNNEYKIGSSGGSSTHALTMLELPPHTHNVSGVKITESTTGGSLFSGGEDSITPWNDGRTSSTGEGEAFNIMPPYYVLAYIMKL